MGSHALVACFALGGALACTLAIAADAAPPALARAVAAPSAGAENEPARAGEPAVKLTVIEDGRARIEELRVRGQLQRISVAPKGNVPGYEVLLGDRSHEFGDDPGTSRGSAGKRVWNVLRF